MSFPAAVANFDQSLPSIWPVRALCAETRASVHIIRCTSCCFDISSENIPTPAPAPMDMFVARFSTKAVFPIEGRAARMTRSEGWKPAVMASIS